ncbi:MAG: fold metallo-hydrolase [Variovorax sp.]|nr:fold metallo-hydrolase [Variovorax sp.]
MNEPQASLHEIGPDTYRISVAMPPSIFPGGFSFNQYLVVDDKPLLFHSGPRKMFGMIAAQIEKVLPVAQLRYIALSHVEADECGGLPAFLAVAPHAQPVCSSIAALVSVSDLVDVAPLGLDDGQALDLGRHQLEWQYTPHLPHGWECGYLFDQTTKTLFCGDLFTQPGTGDQALSTSDILGPSEAFRGQLDYFSHSRNAPALIEKLARLEPQLLACMHGSAWSGDGAGLLRSLGQALAH